MESVEKKLEKSSEVLEKAARRRYSREYKERMVAEADGLTELGQLGALLRREGLYSGAITRWRKELQGTKTWERIRNVQPNRLPLRRMRVSNARTNV